jgi:NAD(P)-dependent dehydrogenase (short-subunit alcohol dehydrogenase family)
MDVRDASSVEIGIRYILEKEERIDIVVNNAGFGLAGAFEDCSVEEVKGQFETNVFGVIRVCQSLIPHMRNRGGHGKRRAEWPSAIQPGTPFGKDFADPFSCPALSSWQTLQSHGSKAQGNPAGSRIRMADDEGLYALKIFGVSPNIFKAAETSA